MKKESTSTNWPEKEEGKTNWVLIPMLTGKEDQERFLSKVSEKNSRVVLANVIDSTRTNLSPQELEGSIQEKDKAMEEAAEFLRMKRVNVSTAEEWGKFPQKLVNIFKKEELDQVIVLNDGREETEQKIKELKSTELPVKVI